jgi:DHA3 family macrolide efflux protein-like MFS transporter
MTDKNFVSLLFGVLFSVLGDAAYFIVLGWFVLNVTGSQFALGTTLTLASVPRIVFMLIGGVFADRVNRKSILVVSLLTRALILALFVIVLMLRHDRPALWVIDLIALAFGTIDAFFYPANNSVVPSVVPRSVLDRANSLVQTVQQLSTVLGPLLAAGLLWFSKYHDMFAVIAAIFAVSSLILSFLRLKNPPKSLGEQALQAELEEANGRDESDESVITPAPSLSMRRDIWEGIQYVLSVRILLMIMVVSLGINLLFMGPINIGVPIYVKSLGWSGSIYGTYESGFGLGTVAGGLLVALMKGFRGRFLWLGGLGAIMGLAMAGIGFVHVAWGGVLLMSVMGMMVSVVNIPFITYIQTIVPSDKLGRTMSLLTLMSVGLVPVSYTVSSFVLQQRQIHVEGLLLVCGLAVAVLFSSLYLLRDFRQVEMHPLWRR